MLNDHQQQPRQRRNNLPFDPTITTSSSNGRGNGRYNGTILLKSLTSYMIVLSIFLIFISNFTTYQFWIHVINRLIGARPIADTNHDIFQLIESRGFNYEQHFLTTKDGYILQLVRLINPLISHSNKRKELKPVLLHHGFQCTGTIWLIGYDGFLEHDDDHNGTGDGVYYEFDQQKNIMTTTPSDTRINNNSINHHRQQIGNNLAFVLAMKNYDVWLANYRGSYYSTNHTKFNPELDSNFWKFSIDEMIKYDLPAEIDYILEKTNRTSLGYIGHSQGNFMMFALMSLDDERAQKIKPFIAISPMFYQFNTTQYGINWIKLSLPFRNILRYFSWRTPFSNKIRLLIANFGHNNLIRKFISLLNYILVGLKENKIIPERSPVYLSHMTMGSSSWNYAHLIQLSLNAYPKQFDYGWEELNLKYYGRKYPPYYNIKKINSTRIALIYSIGDSINNPSSINLLKLNLNVKLLDDYQLIDQTYDHMDYLLAKDCGHFVNKRILQLLNTFS